ncbi:proteasome-type protease [soil metagenome]
MTYGVGLLLNDGLVLAADTRTNAGVDDIATFKKLHVWHRDDDRVFVLLTAGNLAITQAVVSILTEGTGRLPRKNAPPSLFSVETMFQAARVIGKAIREVRKIDGDALSTNSESFKASFILGGQIKGDRPHLFQIYSAGNFIEASNDTPYFQIGEHKYGKPILDRTTDPEMQLGEAVKLVLLSFDSTLRSNLTVGLPIDLVVYNAGSLRLDRVRRIERDNDYFQKLSRDWSRALRHAFSDIDDFDI